MQVLIDGQIVLYGTVGEDLWGDGFTARDVVGALAELGRDTDVTVRLNSGGGYVDDGIGIYNALAAHKGKVTLFVDGIAASSASLIAMSGDEVIMRRGSVMMIHDPAQITIGTAEDHAKTIEQLDAYGNSFAGIYAERTGQTVDAARADMREEIWLTADQAVERGYADRTDDADAERPTAFAYKLYRHTPKPIMAAANVTGPAKSARKKAAVSAATPRQPLETSMATEKPADAASATPTMSVADHTAELNRVKTEATAAADAKVTAERERIASIMDCEEAKGREAQARHIAFKTTMSLDDAKAMLEAAPKAESKHSQANRFEQAMATAGNPKVGPDGAPGTQQDEDEATAEAAAIVRAHRGPEAA